MEKRTEVQCRVQYISTNADALVTHNPTKAQEHSITPTGPLCPFQSKAGMVPFPPSRFSVLPKSKDILLHKRGKTVKTWTSTMLIIVWSNLQTWLIHVTHYLTTILLEKDTFLHWMQSRITHHTYLSCRLSLLQTGDSCSHWASTSLQARLCRLPLNLGLPVDSSRYTTPEVTVPLPGYPVRRHDASLSLHWVRTGSASFLTVKFLFSYPMAICFKMM